MTSCCFHCFDALVVVLVLFWQSFLIHLLVLLQLRVDSADHQFVPLESLTILGIRKARLSVATWGQSCASRNLHCGRYCESCPLYYCVVACRAYWTYLGFSRISVVPLSEMQMLPNQLYLPIRDHNKPSSCDRGCLWTRWRVCLRTLRTSCRVCQTHLPTKQCHERLNTWLSALQSLLHSSCRCPYRVSNEWVRVPWIRRFRRLRTSLWNTSSSLVGLIRSLMLGGPRLQQRHLPFKSLCRTSLHHSSLGCILVIVLARSCVFDFIKIDYNLPDSGKLVG